MDWRTGDRPGCRLPCRLSLVSIGYLQLLHHHATNAGIMLVSRRTGKAVVGANEYSLYAAMRVPARRPFGGRWCGCARCRQGWLLLHSILLFYGTQQYGRCLIYSACPNSLSPSTARSLRCPPKNEYANGGKENGNSPYNKFIRNNLCNGAMNEPCLMVRKSLRFSFPPTQKTS